MEQEIWKDVVGYEGIYQVSNLGRVKSLEKKYKTNKVGYYNKPERILKLIPRASGSKYLCVSLSKNNNVKLSAVHQIVMAAFVGERKNNDVINHIDGNPSNNNLSNLEYCTQSHNRKQDFIHGRQSLTGEKNTQSKLTEQNVFEIIHLRKTRKLTYRELSAIYGVHVCGISNIFNGHTWTHITKFKNKWKKDFPKTTNSTI